jgi:transcription elongation GreA/GreB family factor
MENQHELLVSASDAEVLALELGKRRHANPADAAADALADLLTAARLVPHELLPGDRAAMNSRVTYEEEPAGPRRTVTLVHPMEADAACGRASILSRVGRALFGRAPGAVIDAGFPAGRRRTIRVLAVEKPVAGSRY